MAQADGLGHDVDDEPAQAGQGPYPRHAARGCKERLLVAPLISQEPLFDLPLEVEVQERPAGSGKSVDRDEQPSKPQAALEELKKLRPVSTQ